jgi:hypothetical protein
MRPATEARLIAAGELLIGAAAIVSAAAPLLPWCTATLKPVDPGANMAGLMAPQGTIDGLYAHPTLKVVMVLAVLQLALLLARHYRSGHLRAPGYSYLLAVASAVICLIVAADVLYIAAPWEGILSVNGTLSIPVPWWGTPVPLDGGTVIMTWRYGAIVALTAALASFACAVFLTGVLTQARRQAWHEPHTAEPELG